MKARVTVDSSLALGTHTAQQCSKTGAWLTIGSFGPPSRPIDDGGSDQGANVSVTCSVRPSGAGFAVSAHAELTGVNGGAVTMTGSFQSTGTQPNVTLAMTKQGATFSASDCVATFDGVSQGIAAGRIWVNVACANATQPAAAQTCKAQAQLRFENCTQQ